MAKAETNTLPEVPEMVVEVVAAMQLEDNTDAPEVTEANVEVEEIEMAAGFSMVNYK